MFGSRTDAIIANPKTHQQLKCTSHKEGCDRCRSKKIVCSYIPPIQDRLKQHDSRRPSSISSTLSSAADSRQRAAENRAKRIVADTTTKPLAMNDSSPEALPQTDYMYLDDTQNNGLAQLEGWSQGPQEDQLTILEPNSLPSVGPKNDSCLLSGSSLTGQVTSSNCSDIMDFLSFDSFPDDMSPASAASDCIGPGALHKPQIQSMAVPLFEGNVVSPGDPQNPRANLSESSLRQARGTTKNVSRDVLPDAPTRSQRAWNLLHPGNRDAESPCACIHKVLELHEEVEEVSPTSSAMSMGESLALQIAALRKCLNILDCEACTHSSAISMLLITICNRLLHISQTLSSQLWEWFMHGPRLHPQLVTDLQDADVDNGVDDLRGKLSMDQLVSIGAYKVDNRTERAIIVLKAIEFRVPILCTILNHLRDLATCANQNKHLTRIHALSARVKNHLADLKDSSTDVVMISRS